MAKKIEKSEARCTSLALNSPVTFFREQGKETSLTNFEIEAYTGAVVDRWWGKLAIAVDGISARQQIPILKNHDASQIVGYSTGTSNAGGSFSLQGKFSAVTEVGKETRELALEGFPWQASIGVAPKTILEIEAGASTTVNGLEVFGPAEVWLESEVYETSFVPLGADSNTGVTVFEREDHRAGGSKKLKEEPFEKGESMDLAQLKKEQKELLASYRQELLAAVTREELEAAGNPLVAELVKAGVQQELARAKEVREQLMPGHEALIEQLASDGKSTGADAAIAIVAAEKEARARAAQALSSEANPPVTATDSGDAGPAVIKREEFNKLSPAAQKSFVQQGGRVQ